MIIGLLAQKRNGKDTVGDHLVKNYGFHKYSFADPFKEACKHMFLFTDEQCYGDLKETVDPRWGVTPREVFMIMGTELSQFDLMRHLPAMAETIGNNGRTIWFHRFKLEAEQHPERNYVIADVRFKHEVDNIMKIDGHIIKIVRPGFENGSTHASEVEVNQAPYDSLVLNSGSLEQLYAKVDQEMAALGIPKVKRASLFARIMNRLTGQVSR